MRMGIRKEGEKGQNQLGILCNSALALVVIKPPCLISSGNLTDTPYKMSENSHLNLGSKLGSELSKLSSTLGMTNVRAFQILKR